MAENDVMKVNMKALKACMTCRLCNNLFRQPTAISLCLHTFCRKCIYNRLSDGGVGTCPVCDIDLGCNPLDKLRRDYNLEDIRAKIFPLKRRKVVKPSSEIVTSIAKPAKRKEISLSSLPVPIPTFTQRKQVGVTASQPKPGKSKSPHASSSPPKSLSEISLRKMQGSSVVEPSNEDRSNGSGDDDCVIIAERKKADVWTSLNSLVEGSSDRTKSSKPNSQVQSLAEWEPSNAVEPKSTEEEPKVESEAVQGSKTLVVENKSKEHDHEIKVCDAEKNCINPMSNGGIRNCSVWLSLVANDDKNGDASLPQIPGCYLRIKDSKTMVSSIQKYIVKKLELSNETEVEIKCRGEPVVPTLQLQNLVDLWLRNATTKQVAAPLVGSSAKEFVMVLSYCRKVQAS